MRLSASSLAEQLQQELIDAVLGDLLKRVLSLYLISFLIKSAVLSEV